MEQRLRIYYEWATFSSDFAEMTADGWTVQHLTNVANSSGGIEHWTVVWVRHADLSPAALAYLAACPDPAIAAEATRIILDRSR